MAKKESIKESEANEAQREKEAKGLSVQSNKVLQCAKRNLIDIGAKHQG